MTSEETNASNAMPSTGVQTPGMGETPSSALQPAKTSSRPSPRRLARIGAIVLLLGICAAAVWYWGIREPEPKDDLGRFQGSWKQTVVGQDERLPAHTVRISGDRWQYLEGGMEGKSFRITLNETSSPKQIELTLLDASGNPVGAYGSHGIYSIDRGEARIAVEPVNKPRPKDFDNPDAVVWVLTR